VTPRISLIYPQSSSPLIDIMLCQACDGITLEALHSPYGYEHSASFYHLKASAEAELCGLCQLLWDAVTGVALQEPKANSFMGYPVHLCLNGILRDFGAKGINKALDSKILPDLVVASQIFRLRTSKTPSTMLVCALKPSDMFSKEEFTTCHQGTVSLYREPGIQCHFTVALREANFNSYAGMEFWDNPYGGRPVSSHANSSECFQLAMRWIQSCLTEHDGCRRAVCPHEYTQDSDNEWRMESHSDSSDDSEDCDQPSQKRRKLESGSDQSTLLDSSPSQSSKQFVSRCPSPHVTKPTFLRTGLLNRPIPAARFSKTFPSVDDGYWKLHLRSDSLKELEQNESELLQDCNIPFLPTRYIFIDSNPPRLCDATPGSRGYYVALSHCWGKSKPFTTTTANLKDRLGGIETSSMPRTFRDAIMVTRELGLQYLWIDSLCILQDSKEDWQKESAKMSDVYGNAFLTISAAASADSTQGIFVPRSTPSIPPVEIRPRDSDYTSLYAAKFVENMPMETRQLVDERAWCFQEMALSPRVLVYGAEMLGWVCDSITDVEHGCTYSHDEDPSPPLLAPRIHRKLLPEPIKHGGEAFEFFQFIDDQENDLGLWPSIINEYTRRKITHESDRLPALSGVVQKIHLETGDEYLAGLWREMLGHQLAWQVDVVFGSESTEWKRPAKYRAPSWSWASIEGPVTMRLQDGHKLRNEEKFRRSSNLQTFRLLEAKVDVAGLDPFGEVSGGHLQLSARLKEVTLRVQDRTFDSSDPLWEIKRFQERYFNVWDIHGSCIGSCCIDMPFTLGSENAMWWLSLNCSEGILIEKGTKEGQYSRVGQVWSTDEQLWWTSPEDKYEDVILV
jgi:hypothetical protein